MGMMRRETIGKPLSTNPAKVFYFPTPVALLKLTIVNLQVRCPRCEFAERVLIAPLKKRQPLNSEDAPTTHVGVQAEPTGGSFLARPARRCSLHFTESYKD